MRTEMTTRPLRELVRGFHSGAILLPQFQRDYVWKSAKIRNLLDSLLKGFPIGGFYLWRPATGTRDAKPKAHGQQRIAAEFVGYLIDGQQRLTSLEAAFGLYTGEDKYGAALRCYLYLVADHDLRRKTEEILRLIPSWDAKRVVTALARFDRACEMLNQQVPCTTVYDVSDKEAVEVFSRLNKGGSALKQGDVRAAELARGHAVDVLKSMREFVTGECPQRLGFGFSFAFRALVVFHRESAQFSTLNPDWMDSPATHGRSLRESWRATERAIEKALGFVDKRMGWSRRALLPRQTQSLCWLRPSTKRNSSSARTPSNCIGAGSASPHSGACSRGRSKLPLTASKSLR